MREKKETFLWFLTRKWKSGSWWIKTWDLKFCKHLREDHWTSRATADLLKDSGHSYLIFVHFACRAVNSMHRGSFLASFSKYSMSFLLERLQPFSSKIKKFRQNFFLREFNQIERKKMKALSNSFWRDFRKKTFFAKRFAFFWKI